MAFMCCATVRCIWVLICPFWCQCWGLHRNPQGLWDSWMLINLKQRLHLWMQKTHSKCSSLLKPVGSKLRIKARVINWNAYKHQGIIWRDKAVFSSSYWCQVVKWECGSRPLDFSFQVTAWPIWECLEPGGWGCLGTARSGPSCAICELCDPGK